MFRLVQFQHSATYHTRLSLVMPGQGSPLAVGTGSFMTEKENCFNYTKVHDLKLDDPCRGDKVPVYMCLAVQPWKAGAWQEWHGSLACP